MADREILITNKNIIKPKHRCNHEPYEYYKYEITSRHKDQKCYVAIYEIPPLKSNYPYHYHQDNEEVFYIISGFGILETQDGNKEVNAGDVIVCPPASRGAHKLTNSSQTEKLVYIDFDTVNSPDLVHYPHSNKIGVNVNGEFSLFYKKESNVDYYEGE